MPTSIPGEVHEGLRTGILDGSTDVIRGHAVIRTSTSQSSAKSSTSQGEKVDGIAATGATADGEIFTYVTRGICLAIVKDSTAVTYGAQLTSAGNGTVEPAGSGDVILGKALSTASASYTGQMVMVELAIENYYPHA